MPPPRLILDFDGVVCDATTECALITWLGVHPPDPGIAVSSYLAAMPRGFVERFCNIRGYARLLQHFLVAHRPAAAHVRDRARFNMIFSCIADAYVRDFRRPGMRRRRSGWACTSCIRRLRGCCGRTPARWPW